MELAFHILGIVCYTLGIVCYTLGSVYYAVALVCLIVEHLRQRDKH